MGRELLGNDAPESEPPATGFARSGTFAFVMPSPSAAPLRPELCHRANPETRAGAAGHRQSIPARGPARPAPGRGDASECYEVPWQCRLISQDADAIVFFLVSPSRTVKGLAHKRSQHGLNAEWNGVGHDVRPAAGGGHCAAGVIAQSVIA